jgi:hypothetical protein
MGLALDDKETKLSTKKSSTSATTCIQNKNIILPTRVTHKLKKHFLYILSSTHFNNKVKVKLSRNRPWRPIGLSDVKDPTLSRQSAHRRR